MFRSFPRPRTLFSKTLVTIAGVSVGFQLFTVTVIAVFMLFPVGQRSADDLAALMVLSAQTWVELPPETRGAFESELTRSHHLVLTAAEKPLPITTSWLPYVSFLEHSLTDRLGRPVNLETSHDEQGTTWYWADIPMGGHPIRVGFSRDRIGVRPPTAFLIVLVVGTLVTVATVVVLVRRLTAPLESLSGAARRLGEGAWPEPVPETGAEELAALAQSFNHMVGRVRELLANRTTLLAGISHDLRTPLSRLRLALDMVPPDADPALIDGMQRDVEEMDGLIGQFLEISRELERGRKESVDVTELLDGIVADARRGGGEVEWEGTGPCAYMLHPLALRRVITNLVDNALRYGAGHPVRVVCRCEAPLRIRVLDRGPGIPPGEREAVFRPFHRLEGSRSTRTGGSGLGLAVARQLAEANGWRIELRGREGGGTEAVVTVSEWRV